MRFKNTCYNAPNTFILTCSLRLRYDGERRFRPISPPTGSRIFLRIVPPRPFCGEPTSGYRRPPDHARQVAPRAGFRDDLPRIIATGLQLPQAGSGYLRRTGDERAEQAAGAISSQRSAFSRQRKADRRSRLVVLLGASFVNSNKLTAVSFQP